MSPGRYAVQGPPRERVFQEGGAEEFALAIQQRQCPCGSENDVGRPDPYR